MEKTKVTREEKQKKKNTANNKEHAKETRWRLFEEYKQFQSCSGNRLKRLLCRCYELGVPAHMQCNG